MIEGSIFSLSSISRTLGPTTSTAKRRTGECVVGGEYRGRETYIPDSLSICSSSVKLSNDVGTEASLRMHLEVEKALVIRKIY